MRPYSSVPLQLWYLYGFEPCVICTNNVFGTHWQLVTPIWIIINVNALLSYHEPVLVYSHICQVSVPAHEGPATPQYFKHPTRIVAPGQLRTERHPAIQPERPLVVIFSSAIISSGD